MSDEPACPWRSDDKGVTVLVRLTPRGGRDSIDGSGALSDGRSVLLARVRPPPEDGAANSALLKLLAKTAGIPTSAARIESGQASRLKTIHLSGDSARIDAALSACIAKIGTKSSKR